MALKAFLTIVGLMALTIGLVLPTHPGRDRAEATSQIPVLEIASN